MNKLGKKQLFEKPCDELPPSKCMKYALKENGDSLIMAVDNSILNNPKFFGGFFTNHELQSRSTTPPTHIDCDYSPHYVFSKEVKVADYIYNPALQLFKSLNPKQKPKYYYESNNDNKTPILIQGKHKSVIIPTSYSGVTEIMVTINEYNQLKQQYSKDDLIQMGMKITSKDTKEQMLCRFIKEKLKRR